MQRILRCLLNNTLFSIWQRPKKCWAFLMIELIEVLNGIASVAQIAREGSFRGAMRKQRNRVSERCGGMLRCWKRPLGFPIFHRTTDGICPYCGKGRPSLPRLKTSRPLSRRYCGWANPWSTRPGARSCSPRRKASGPSGSLPNSRLSIESIPASPSGFIRAWAWRTCGGSRLILPLQVVEPVLPEIKRVKVGRLHLMLAAAPSYIARHGKPNEVADLARPYVRISHQSTVQRSSDYRGCSGIAG